MEVTMPNIAQSSLRRDPSEYSVPSFSGGGCLHEIISHSKCDECRGVFHECKICGLYVPCDLEEGSCLRSCNAWAPWTEFCYGCWTLHERCAVPEGDGLYSAGVNFMLSSLSECGMRVCKLGADYFEFRRDGLGPTNGIMKYCHKHFIEDRGAPSSYYPRGQYRAHGRRYW